MWIIVVLIVLAVLFFALMAHLGGIEKSLRAGLTVKTPLAPNVVAGAVEGAVAKPLRHFRLTSPASAQMRPVGEDSANTLTIAWQPDPAGAGSVVGIKLVGSARARNSIRYRSMAQRIVAVLEADTVAAR